MRVEGTVTSLGRRIGFINSDGISNSFRPINVCRGSVVDVGSRVEFTPVMTPEDLGRAMPEIKMALERV